MDSERGAAGQMAVLCSVGVAVLGWLSGPTAAYAQQGVQLGDFLVQPRIEVQPQYNDNIYTTSSQRKSDEILIVAPTIGVHSQFDRHAINLNASAEQGWYRHNGDNDYSDFAFAGDGRLDVWQDGNAFGGAAYRQQHENRGSANNSDGKEPIVYDVLTLSGGAAQRLGAFSARFELKSDDYDYGLVPREGLADLSNDDRDRRETAPTLRLGYAVTPSYELFARGGMNDRDYDQSTDRNGFARSSDGYDAVGGVGFGLPGVFTGELFAGYMQQDYSDAQFDTVRTAKAGWGFEYIPVPRLALRSSANRTIDETTTAGASSLITSSVNVSADFDLTRDIIVRSELGFVHQKYVGTSQRDNLATAGIGFVYSITDNFYVGPTYRYSARDSNVDTSDYHQNVIMLRFGAQM